jgi:SAM-dependent methyltransferase
MDAKRSHWNQIYSERTPTGVSWYQAEPTLSLELIRACGLDLSQAALIDVGGGASVLVDRLLSLGCPRPTVLDISATALADDQRRLGADASKVQWIEADITTAELPATYDLWHDRAVFHFLIETADREKYHQQLERHLRPGGFLVLASFALDGPERCSNLPVCRYGAESIQAELGPSYKLLETRAERHQTPRQTEQRFNYFRFQKL